MHPGENLRRRLSRGFPWTLRFGNLNAGPWCQVPAPLSWVLSRTRRKKEGPSKRALPFSDPRPAFRRWGGLALLRLALQHIPAFVLPAQIKTDHAGGIAHFFRQSLHPLVVHVLGGAGNADCADNHVGGIANRSCDAANAVFILFQVQRVTSLCVIAHPTQPCVERNIIA